MSALRRTWPQRLLIAAVSVAALASLVSAGLVFATQQQLENRQIVSLDSNPVAADGGGESAGAAEPTEVETNGGGDDDGLGASIDTDGTAATAAPPPDDAASSVPVETFPEAEPGARNILITGADNNACLDPDSRFAAAFGDRSDAGERSDTIMMWRINPDTSQLAVLSFPRDLWVPIDGRSSKGRINEAYERDDPQRLINTIMQNFGIETDHFVQVDFCAFRELVDAVDGVAVPFDTPVRDGATGLIVEEPGCFTFSGEHALAYVRSRKMEYLTEDGRWERDVSSDLGRISRQQDFIRRVADELLSNAFSPDVVRSLLNVSQEYIVTDDELTIDAILGFAGVLQNSDPVEITTYQIEGDNVTIQGNQVLEPRIGGENMVDVINLFQGQVALADRPEQNLDDTDGEATSSTVPETTVPIVDPDVTTTTPTIVESETSAAPTTETASESTLPVVETEDVVYGVVPDGTQTCA